MAKELVVYFSVYGTAKIVAEEIAKQTGADIAGSSLLSPMTATEITTTHWQGLLRRSMTRISGLRSRTRSTSTATTGSTSVIPCGGTPFR